MEQIGKYRILEKIGEGGFGTIYLGHDPLIQRSVAVKTCTSEDRETRQRFFQEAQIAGNLQHRNITTVYDFGFHDGVPYLVQEYLSGEDLDRKIKRRDPLSFPEKLLYLIQVARGLEYAHAQGVIHRDIKPANVRILEDGTAKIMDFGIAKLANQETGLTQTGMTLGTAAYLAPEQIRGDAVDARTDIFSFGVLAHELLVCRRPFVGAHISAVLFQILNEDPPRLVDVLPDCPDTFQPVIDRCLHKDPAQRYQSCSELLRGLNGLFKDLRASPRADTAPSFAPREAPPERSAAEPDDSSEAPTAAQSDRLDELELSSPLGTSLGRRPLGPSEAPQRRDYPWIPWTVAALCLIAVGAGAWRYSGLLPTGWARTPVSRSDEIAEPGEAPNGRAEPPRAGVRSSSSGSEDQELVEPPASAPVLPAGSENTVPEAEKTVPDAEEETATVPDEEGEPATDAQEMPLSAAPEPLVEPEPGTIVIPASWDSEMTVRIGPGGRPMALDRRRSLQLAAGVYLLVFELSKGAYEDRATTEVQLAEGATRLVEIPLREPGALTVQPRLNTPPGFVYLDGKPQGRSPIRDRKLPPGEHRVSIALDDTGSEAATIQDVLELRSGQTTIVNFDLGAGRIEVRQRPGT